MSSGFIPNPKPVLIISLDLQFLRCEDDVKESSSSCVHCYVFSVIHVLCIKEVLALCIDKSPNRLSHWSASIADGCGNLTCHKELDAVVC